MDGFYAIYYTGFAGSGFGIVVIAKGTISGADASGGTFDGEYEVDNGTGELDGEVRVNVAAGMPLVTGAAPQGQPYTFAIPMKMPSYLGGGDPITVNTPTGPVNVTFKKLREIPI